jgi:hypothetical protein
MMVALVIVGIVVWFLLPILICSATAEEKGYPSGSAGFLGFLLGWIAVLFYALRSNKRKDAREQAARIAQATKSLQATSETDRLPLRLDETAASDDMTKQCPDCAESVKAAALVCRFCGHKFTTEESQKSFEKSLVDALWSRSARMRARAVGMLADQLRERAVPYLVYALNDADWEVRISAVNGLKTANDPSVGQKLFDAMADAFRDARSWRMLWDFETQGRATSFMKAALNTLASFGDAGLPYLLKSLESSRMHSQASLLLAGLDEPVADLLERAAPSCEGILRKRMEAIVADIRRKAPVRGVPSRGP